MKQLKVPWRVLIAVFVATSLIGASAPASAAESGPEVIAVQPSDLVGVPGVWLPIGGDVAASIVNSVATDGSGLAVRAVATTANEALVADVYTGEVKKIVLSIVPLTALSQVPSVTTVTRATAEIDESGGLQMDAEAGPLTTTQYSPQATLAADCTVTCIAVGGLGTILFAGVCLLTTGPFAYACAAFATVGSIGVGAACALEDNPFNCAGVPYGGFYSPQDLDCDFKGCYIKFTINTRGRTVNWYGVGMWWQRVNYPRVYNEWINGMYGPQTDFITGYSYWHNYFEGSPVSHVECSSALDLSVSFWFTDGTHVGVFLRTSANGVPDNNIYKPVSCV